MDAALSKAVRDAEARNDGPTWAAAAQAHLRAGQLEQAAVAARRAIARGTDAMELLDATAPSLEALMARVIDVALGSDGSRPLRFRLERLAWYPTGGTLLASGEVSPPGQPGTSKLSARAGLVRPSPNGGLCVVEPGRAEPRAPSPTGALLLDARTGARQHVEHEGWLIDAAWSPSGRRVALAFDPPGTGPTQIVLLEPGPVRTR